MFLSSLTSLVCHLKNVTFGHKLKHSHSSDDITIMIEGEVQFGLDNLYGLCGGGGIIPRETVKQCASNFAAAAAAKFEALCYHKFYPFQVWQAQLKLSDVTANNCNNTAGRKNRTVSTQLEINYRHVSSVE
ncbi:hypothetical protein P5673_019189 [Acropora cervicornis]|uniref:Uncharacterized protein n=1 Tax=Acropora cervicornis TaxID=6130 RepID=A0AAD9QCQ9_ACRCE|nr:hypothetical protein P5673_019189 [Acropora cervicornis]